MSLILPFLAVLAFAFKLHGESPSAAFIKGRTFEMNISEGDSPFARYGSFRFLPSATDNSYIILASSFGSPVDSTVGTYTYTKAGPNAARIVLADRELGGLIVQATFGATGENGSYTITSTSFPGKQTGSFSLSAGESPSSMIQEVIYFGITGGGTFPFFGDFLSFLVYPNTNGMYHTLTARSGDQIRSRGTYSYTKVSAFNGLMKINDSVNGNDLTLFLTFASPRYGSCIIRMPGNNEYQTAEFSLRAREPQLVQPMADVKAFAGSAATFEVQAFDTRPLTYEWSRFVYSPIGGGTLLEERIEGASHSQYTIQNVSAKDAGYYYVKVTNSEKMSFKTRAFLKVINFVSPTLKSLGMKPDGYSFEVSGEDTTIRVEWSDNGSEWNFLKSVTRYEVITDPASLNEPFRMYRASLVVP